MANRRGKCWSSDNFIFLGMQITADGDCSLEIKKHLLLGRKAITNLDCTSKSRNITLLTKVHIVKAMVFPVVIYEHDSWSVSPLDCKIKPVNPKGNQPWIFIGRTDAEAEALATWWEVLTHWERPWCWERLQAKGERGGRGWDSYLASLTHWTRIWANSRKYWRTGDSGVLQSEWSKRAGHDLATE